MFISTHLGPSLVFLRSLTNRLFVEAEEQLGGLKARDWNSLEKSFISFISPRQACCWVSLLSWNCYRCLNPEWGCLACIPSVIPEMFPAGLTEQNHSAAASPFLHSGTKGAADVSSPQPAVGVRWAGRRLVRVTNTTSQCLWGAWNTRLSLWTKAVCFKLIKKLQMCSGYTAAPWYHAHDWCTQIQTKSVLNNQSEHHLS